MRAVIESTSLANGSDELVGEEQPRVLADEFRPELDRMGRSGPNSAGVEPTGNRYQPRIVTCKDGVRPGPFRRPEGRSQAMGDSFIAEKEKAAVNGIPATIKPDCGQSGNPPPARPRADALPRWVGIEFKMWKRVARFGIVPSGEAEKGPEVPGWHLEDDLKLAHG
jgi:hypothetical protein